MSTPFEDGRSFPTKFRGFDPAEVRRFVEQRDAQLADLQREKDQLVARLEQLGETSIDFDSFADELRLILEAAHQAADTLRKRASDEVSTWRDMAAKEVEDTRKDATEAAENLRRDAWIASETLVQQAQAESKTEVEGSARESLAIVGKAERDSHRIQSNARRESEEVMRLARMEAERMMVDARAQHDEVVEQARKQADAAQERARALEVRRAELLTELDSVQVAVARLEDDLKRKREELEAAPQPVLSAYDEPSPSVKVLETDEEPAQWNTDAIKLIPAEKKVLEPASIPVDASEMAEEVRLLNDSRASSFADIKIIPPDAGRVDDGPSAPIEPESAEESDTDPADTGDPAPNSAEPAADEVDEPTVATPVIDLTPADEEPVSAAAPDRVDSVSVPLAGIDDIGGLFAALRETAEVPVVAAPAPLEGDEAAAPVTAAPAVEPASPSAAVPVDAPSDALELRDHLLLPIMNRVLRDIKRQLTEAQNLALEQLRTAEDEWEPDVSDLTERVHGDLTIVAQESFAAGYDAVEVSTGQHPGRPKSRKSDIPNASGEFAEALANDLVTAAAKGDGPRAASASVSRAYRAWRTDTAERRVRSISRAAYHRGVARALSVIDEPTMVWAVAGRGCAECRAIAEAGPVTTSGGFAGGIVPPLHPECSCTVVPGA